MIGGGGIKVERLVAKLSEDLADQHHFRFGSGHHEVHFLALGDPAKPVAVPALTQEMRRTQAGDREVLSGPCRGDNMPGASQVANAASGIKIIGVLNPILRQRKRHRRLRRRHGTIGRCAGSYRGCRGACGGIDGTDAGG